MQQISCIFCGQESQDVFIKENGFSGVKCSICKLIYISPRPDIEQITHLYTDQHALLYADAQFQFDAFNRMEASRTLAKIRNIKRKSAILELGPGGGCFLSEARKRGYEPYGIELNPIEARWINQKLQIPCETTPLSLNSFNGKLFDLIYHRDVLSHLPDPIGTFGDIHRALTSNGVLMFETGNIADVDKKYLKYFSTFSYPDHLFFFGEKSITTLLEKTGFKVLSIDREPIILQLILQKALWRLKDPLKDKKGAEVMSLDDKGPETAGNTLSLKRRLRNAYRYTRHYLGRIGGFLPQDVRPLKLIVLAEKME